MSDKRMDLPVWCPECEAILPEKKREEIRARAERPSEVAALRARLAALTGTLTTTEFAMRTVLGTMQKPMERLNKVCWAGLVEPACDHDNLRALRKAMEVLGGAHDALARALDASRTSPPPTEGEVRARLEQAAQIRRRMKGTML